MNTLACSLSTCRQRYPAQQMQSTYQLTAMRPPRSASLTRPGSYTVCSPVMPLRSFSQTYVCTCLHSCLFASLHTAGRVHQGHRPACRDHACERSWRAACQRYRLCSAPHTPTHGLVCGMPGGALSASKQGTGHEGVVCLTAAAAASATYKYMPMLAALLQLCPFSLYVQMYEHGPACIFACILRAAKPQVHIGWPQPM